MAKVSMKMRELKRQQLAEKFAEKTPRTESYY